MNNSNNTTINLEKMMNSLMTQKEWKEKKKTTSLMNMSNDTCTMINTSNKKTMMKWHAGNGMKDTRPRQARPPDPDPMDMMI